ncbi:MAG: hypothetical protein ACFFCS_07315 [Candidatus Hodarchaeota archaeon]
MANAFVEVITWFGRHNAWLLLPAVGIIYTWAIEAKKRKEDLDRDEWQRNAKVSNIVKLFSYIGMVYGFFLMIGAIMTEITGYSPSYMYMMNIGGGTDEVNHFTVILYLVTGLIMFMKPLKDVPFAAIISLTAAAAVTLIVMFSVNPDEPWVVFIGSYFDIRWLYLIIFVIVLAIVYSLSKVSFTLMMNISKLISKAPFALIYGSFILIQAVVLLFGGSLVLW